MRRDAGWLAVLWTLAVGGFLLYGPVYGTQSSGIAISANGSRMETTSRGSSGLAAEEGLWAYVVVLVPVILAGIPLLAREGPVRRGLAAAAAVVLGALALVGAMSVGLFYVPAVVALALLAVPEQPQRPAA